MDEVCVEEGDVEAMESEKLCKLQHGADMALRWTGEDGHVGISCFFRLHLCSCCVFFLCFAHICFINNGYHWLEKKDKRKEND